MRRPLVVVVVLVLLIMAAIVAVHLRGEEPILAETVPVASAGRPTPSLPPALGTTPAPTPAAEAAAPPSSIADRSPEPEAPPEGCMWWGSFAFRRDARIQSNHVVNGYAVPVEYANDGTLQVASKYPDHSSCIWAYDCASGKFEVLYQKTRQAVECFWEYETCDRLVWWEQSREPDWTYVDGISTRRGDRLVGSRTGGARGDQCYAPRPDRSEGNNFFVEYTKTEYPRVSLNGGAFQLVYSTTESFTHVPLFGYRVPRPTRHVTTLYDPVAQRVLSTLEGRLDCRYHWDFGRGLALVIGTGMHRDGPQPLVAALLAYPDLRVVGRGDVADSRRYGGLQLLPSVKDLLAVDVVCGVPRKDTLSILAAPPTHSGLYRVRVPDNWRTVPGRSHTDSIWDDHPAGLTKLEVTDWGVFDVAKYDALQSAVGPEDTVPNNLMCPYAFRDGVMYWRKRHTGEVVMAGIENLDAQTVLGGVGAKWDGFRVNPVRDEVVTWRENGELTFWAVSFPTAEPLQQLRVITDETPHRLEAM